MIRMSTENSASDRNGAALRASSWMIALMPALRIPTLVLQCSADVIAPDVVGQYVHAHVPGSVFTQLAATGHCPHLSAPEETTAAIRAFLPG